MSDAIFLLGDDDWLTEAHSSAHQAEAELQELLAGNVHLLAGAQINRGNPRRWLLIKREADVPNREGGGGWWSIDIWLLTRTACLPSSRWGRVVNPCLHRPPEASVLPQVNAHVPVATLPLPCVWAIGGLFAGQKIIGFVSEKRS